MTLTLKSDLLLKNFNLGHNFLTRSGMASILHMCIPCDKPFRKHGTIIFDLVTLTLKFDLILSNFNLCCYLMMVAARRASLSSDNSYSGMCLSGSRTFMVVAHSFVCYNHQNAKPSKYTVLFKKAKYILGHFTVIAGISLEFGGDGPKAHQLQIRWANGRGYGGRLRPPLGSRGNAPVGGSGGRSPPRENGF